MTEEAKFISVSDSEIRHLRALRLNKGDFLTVSNGRGLGAKCLITSSEKDNWQLQPTHFYYEMNEQGKIFSIGIGILNDRARMEFAVEKAVELGVREIFPLKSNFSGNKKLRSDRLQKKAIAAMKQSKRSRLTTVHKPITLEDLLKKEFKKIILADTKGDKHLDSADDSTLILVGPEGGFSPGETELLNSRENIKFINLGNSRLRAETAVVSIISVFVNKI